MERSEQCVKDFQHILQLALVFLYLHYKTKALFSFIKVETEFWNHHTSKMGDFSLNPLIFLHKTVKFFTENCQLTFSAKFINNTFDKFNNIYYCFLLSGETFESHLGNNWIKNILLHINFTAFLKVFLERLFGDHQLIIETFHNRAYIIAYQNYHSTVCIISYPNNQYFNYLQIKPNVW